jgi:hypothetical protein
MCCDTPRLNSVLILSGLKQNILGIKCLTKGRAGGQYCSRLVVDSFLFVAEAKEQFDEVS